MYSQKQTTG